MIKPIHNGVKIVNKNAGGIILDGFFNLWKEKSLCDVKLVVNLLLLISLKRFTSIHFRYIHVFSN